MTLRVCALAMLDVNDDVFHGSDQLLLSEEIRRSPARRPRRRRLRPVSPLPRTGGGANARSSVFEPPVADGQLEREVRQRSRGDRLFLGAHDAFERRVARLAEGQRRREQGRQRRANGLIAGVGLALDRASSPSTISTLRALVTHGSPRCSASAPGTAPVLLSSVSPPTIEQIEVELAQRVRHRVGSRPNVASLEACVAKQDGVVRAHRQRLAQRLFQRLGRHRKDGDARVAAGAFLQLKPGLERVLVVRIENRLDAGAHQTVWSADRCASRRSDPERA